MNYSSETACLLTAPWESEPDSRCQLTSRTQSKQREQLHHPKKSKISIVTWGRNQMKS
ncbi:hypothetical protein M378DRAFT_171236, partial [Amanita muscaria Koide BX008]